MAFAHWIVSVGRLARLAGHVNQPTSTAARTTREHDLDEQLRDVHVLSFVSMY